MLRAVYRARAMPPCRPPRQRPTGCRTRHLHWMRYTRRGRAASRPPCAGAPLAGCMSICNASAGPRAGAPPTGSVSDQHASRATFDSHWRRLNDRRYRYLRTSATPSAISIPRRPLPMRLILYLGKGGVGKTTLSAATAARAGRLGKRTLVVSTDLAHSLADALDTSLTAEPQAIGDNLWAQQLNVLHAIRTHCSRMQEYVSTLLKKQAVNYVAAQQMALIPCMDEILALLNIHQQPP